MKFLRITAIALTLTLLLAACSKAPGQPSTTVGDATTAGEVTDATEPSESLGSDVTKIEYSDDSVTVNGKPADSNTESPVYTSNDIVYYEAGKDFTYGEGSEEDAHTPDEAAAHTVIHITEAGKYSLRGKLSHGQIAVDLGDEAKNNPEAVVTLILDGIDVTCEVAPAVIFYNTYECGSDDTESATKDVDTSRAGANVIISDDTVNNVNGSYVARIYDPGTVVLSEDGYSVADADKLHKYDAAFYSKRSINVSSGEKGTGILNINAENEGLDSELHLTINGGNINIISGNDGINTNEDGVSVTTVNGGSLKIRVSGETGEGDGIDSNGWLVINGGTVIAEACSDSADAGIDSDMGIHINGGTVIASGHMLDAIESEGQSYTLFNLRQNGSSEKTQLFIKDSEGNTVREIETENAYSILIFSSPELTEDSTYTLWDADTQLAEQSSDMGGHGGMQPPRW